MIIETGYMKDNFHRGQKVYAYYHHTWNVRKPMLAKVLCKAMVKDHLFSGIKYGNKETGKCQWYWIMCKGNVFPSLFPETCLEDCREYVDKNTPILEEYKERIGEEGYDIDSVRYFENSIIECENYTASNVNNIDRYRRIRLNDN